MGSTASGGRKLSKLEKPAVGISNPSQRANCSTNFNTPKEASKKSWGEGASVKFVPRCRVRYAKKLSGAMREMMEEKFIRGFRKYGNNIEDKPLINEILEEIIDLSNYYLTFVERSKKLVSMAKNPLTRSSALRKNIIKLLT